MEWATIWRAHVAFSRIYASPTDANGWNRLQNILKHHEVRAPCHELWKMWKMQEMPNWRGFLAFRRNMSRAK